ncbi:MAG: YicC family protein [Treponemataceae bacterium]|nr:YicC family protein [Treponemataceae bacterium]
MKSMTGYAYKEVTTEEAYVSVEFKSWNSRFLDLNLNIPPFLGRLESVVREQVQNSVLRGKVDVNIRVRLLNAPVTVEIDEAAAQAYLDAFEKLYAKVQGKERYGIGKGFVTELARCDGVMTLNKNIDPDEYWRHIEPVFTAALHDFIADREREGANLAKDLLEKLAKIEECEKLFKDWIPQMEQLFKDNVKKRFAEVLGDAVDEQRVLTETAALLVKYTINEEVVRLQSHIDALKAEMTHNAAPGRKIDFICQEMNREINTIGSKNQFIEVGQAVIEAKDALENIREQAKNVE